MQPPDILNQPMSASLRVRALFLWLAKYKEFSVKAFQQTMQYRARSFLFGLGNVVSFGLLIFMWGAVYRAAQETTIGGLTWEQIQQYFLLTMIISYFVDMPFLGIFGSKIIDGSIATDLIRPVDIQIMLFFDVLGRQASNLLINSLPLAIVVTVYLGKLPIAPENLFLGGIALFLGMSTAFTIDYIIGVLGFWTTNILGMTGIKKLIINISSGMIVPFALMPGWMADIVRYLPFRGIVHLPLQFLQGQLPAEHALRELSIQSAWVVALIIIGRLLFNRASRKITIFGG